MSRQRYSERARTRAAAGTSAAAPGEGPGASAIATEGKLYGAVDPPSGRRAVADHGRELSFGYFLVPEASAPLLASAQRVERLGLDIIGVQDHPYQRRYVDTWMLLSAIAATTERVVLFPDVANLPLRPPAVM